MPPFEREKDEHAWRWFGVLVLALLACLLPAWFQGRVIAAPGDPLLFFLPELDLHLNGNHDGRMGLWNPHVQLGRPGFAGCGHSPAYWLTAVVGSVTSDAWGAYTLAVLATIALGGIFAWLLFRTLGVRPAVASACALGFALCAYHGRFAAFLLYLSGSVWAMGACWAALRFLRAPSAWSGVLVAFTLHSLLLSSYPQQVVLAGWLIAVVALVGATHVPGGRARVLRLAALAGWGAAGAASCLFVYLDLWLKAAESTRFEVGEAFFAPDYPPPELLPRALQELLDPLWRGPTRSRRMPVLWGTSAGPFFGAAALVALAAVRTRFVALFGGAFALLLLLAVVPDARMFCVRHLGLGLSVFNPTVTALVPLFTLSALGFEHCLRGLSPRARLPALLASLLIPLYLLGSTLSGGPGFHPFATFVSLGLSAAALWLCFQPSRIVLTAAALASAAYFGVAWLPLEDRARVEAELGETPLAAEVARRTAPRARYAWVGRDPRPTFAANREVLHGLHSVHSYDPLFPERYARWSRPLGARTDHGGRTFATIPDARRVDVARLSEGGVRLVLSREVLAVPGLRELGSEAGVHFYELLGAAPLEAWIPDGSFVLEDEARARIVPGFGRTAEGVERAPGVEERIELALTPRAQPGLLWLSQQFHPQWRARAGSERLTCVLVDDFYQGVLVPAGTERIVLEFRPWARWAWVPQVLFALAALGLAIRTALARSRRAGLA